MDKQPGCHLIRQEIEELKQKEKQLLSDLTEMKRKVAMLFERSNKATQDLAHMYQSKGINTLAPKKLIRQWC